MKMFTQNITVLLVLVALYMGGNSCTKRGASGKPSNVDYYTCTMHPSVREKEPGKCPICSMDLVPVMKGRVTPASSSNQPPKHDHAAMLAGKSTGGSASAPPSNEFVVPVERQQQIGVTYATVQR